LTATCDVQSLHSKNAVLGFTPIFIAIQKNRINSPLELKPIDAAAFSKQDAAVEKDLMSF